MQGTSSSYRYRENYCTIATRTGTRTSPRDRKRLGLEVLVFTPRGAASRSRGGINAGVLSDVSSFSAG